jgi:hypothetical protein
MPGPKLPVLSQIKQILRAGLSRVTWVAEFMQGQFFNLPTSVRDLVCLEGMEQTMSKKETAFVVVQKTWFDLAMNPLVTGRPSESQVDAHVMIGTLDEISDLRGLWLRDITSRMAKKDGSFVTMRLMIPWQFILSVGLVDESVKIPTGFNNVTVLTAESSDS